MPEVTYTVQMKRAGWWYNLAVAPHHDELLEATERLVQAKLSKPDGEYRILEVTRKIVG